MSLARARRGRALLDDAAGRVGSAEESDAGWCVLFSDRLRYGSGRAGARSNSAVERLKRTAIAAGRDPATLPIAVFSALTAAPTFYECRIVKESGSMDAIAA